MDPLDALIAQHKANGGSGDALDALIAAHQAQQAPPPKTIGGMPVGDESAAAGAGAIEKVPIVGPIAMAGVDRGIAALRQMGLGKATAGNYADELKNVQDWRRGTEEASPKSAALGGMLSTGAIMAPAMALAPEAFGIDAGKSLLANTLWGAGTNAAIGGTDAAIRSGGDLGQIALGTAFGAGGGALGPVLSRGAEAVSNAVSKALPEELAGLSSNARRYVMDRFAPLAQKYQDAMKELGPLATPADVSDEWRYIARAGATKPGMADEIGNFFRTRSEEAPARIQAARTAALGEDVVPSQVRKGIKQGMQAMGPEYDALVAKEGLATDTKPIADWLDTKLADTLGEAKGHLQSVRNNLELPGGTAGGKSVLDPSPVKLKAVQTEVGSRLRTLQKSPGGDEQSITLLKQVKKQIDDELERSVPGMRDLNSRYAEFNRQKNALDLGQTVLDADRANAIRPSEFEDMLKEGVRPTGTMTAPSQEAEMLRQGMNADIARKVGTSTSSELNDLKRAVGAPWNRAKLEAAYPEGGPELLKAIDRERVLQDSANFVRGNSATAGTAAFQNAINDIRAGGRIPTDLTLTGGTLGLGQKVVNAMLGRNAEKTAERFANELTRMSVMSGDQRDKLIAALLQAQGNRVSPLLLQGAATLPIAASRAAAPPS